MRGELSAVRKAVAALPNTSETFPTREDVGTWWATRIKGALQDHPEEAFELFADWVVTLDRRRKPASPGQ